MRLSRQIALVGLTGFAALLVSDQPVLADNPVIYICADGRDFSAEFDEDRVTLLFGGELIDLPQVPSGSGAKYEDDVFIFWDSGDEAVYGVKGQFETTCTPLDD
ncbi:MAG: MliC family protein [Pseudomonadota bacterium]